MSNNIALLNIQLPANFAALSGLGDDDLSQGVSAGFPVMSIRGAKWRISEGGEEKPIYIPGSTDLAPSIRVVLLKANPNISKIYYEGAYVEGSDAPPACSSSDGFHPSPDAPKPQAQSCGACKHNVWGSKISPSGAKIKACGDARRMAILPSDDLQFAPILLRVPGASLTDLADYGKKLKKAGAPYAAVVTKLSFDPAASYPKILFTFERVLTAAEITVVAGRMADPSIEDVIGGAVPVPAAAAEQRSTATQQAPADEPAAEVPAPTPAPAPARTRTRAAAPAQAAATQAPPPDNVVPLHTAAAPAAEPAGVVSGHDVAADIEAELAGLSL